MNEQKNQKFENLDSKWFALINAVNNVKPHFGSLTLELVFHQSALARASIHEKTQNIVFKKEIKND
jgi:hypothetical protein